MKWVKISERSAIVVLQRGPVVSFDNSAQQLLLWWWLNYRLTDDTPTRASHIYYLSASVPIIICARKLTSNVFPSLSPLLYNKRRNLSCVLQSVWLLNICQSRKKNGHLLPIFQRPRQLNQIINGRVSKAKVFYILMENFISQPTKSLVSRKSQFLAA